MVSKTNYAVLGSALVLCLMVFGVYAVSSTTGEFLANPDTIYITWKDAGYGCYANKTTITNNLATPIDITVDNTTTIGGSSFYVNDGTTNQNTMTIAGSGTQDVIFKISNPESADSDSKNITIMNSTNSLENLQVKINFVKPEALSNIVNVGVIPKINIGDTYAEAKFFINNTEDYDIGIDKVENTTTLRSGTLYMEYSHDLDDSDSIAAGTEGEYTLDINIDPDIANSPGIYSDQIKITADNGCPNQIYNLTVSANLTTQLNVAITANSSLTTDRGKNISVGVTPKYLDGLLVEDLIKTNFTATLIHRELNGLTYPGTVVKSEDMGTYYNVTISVPTNALGGDYQVKIDVEDGLGTTVNNSGIGYFGDFSINRPALKIITDCNGKSVNVGATIECDQTVTNYGNDDAEEVNVSYSLCTDYITVVDPDDYSGTIVAGDDRTYSVTLKGKAATSGCDIKITGKSLGGATEWYHDIISAEIIVKAITETESSQESVSSGSSHKLTITPPETFEIEQGDEISKSVIIKNSGSYNENNVQLTLGGIDSTWYDVLTEKQTIVTALQKTYDVDFSIPEDAEPIEYTITYKAKSDSVEGTATGKMKVIPGEKTETEIESNLTEYLEWYGAVLTLFNETKLAGGNVTELDEIEDMLSQINGLLTKADSHIKLGQYFEAYQELKEARLLLEQAESDLNGEKSKFEKMIFDNFILVGSGIAIAVILVGYYFYTHSSKRYKPYKPRGVDFNLKLKPKISGMKLKYENFKKEFKVKKNKLLKKV